MLNALTALGDAVPYRLASGELTVELVDGKVVIREAVRQLFDRHGRRIPPEGLRRAVTDADRDFRVEQPEINHAQVISRVVRFLDAEPTMACDELEERCQAIHERVEADEQNRNLNQGPFVDLWVPALPVDNLGMLLDERLLPAVVAAYSEQFPDRKFYNYRQGELAGQVSYAEGHEAELKLIQQGGAARLYVTPLQGFSVLAQREQVQSLPDWIGLAGLLWPLAMICYPAELARDFSAPGYDLSVLSYWFAGLSLGLGAGGGGRNFGGWGGLGRPRSGYSGGLFVAG